MQFFVVPAKSVPITGLNTCNVKLKTRPIHAPKKDLRLNELCFVKGTNEKRTTFVLIMAETVLVTGTSGYVALHCIKKLLEDGIYKVKGTVRSLKNEERTNAIHSRS